MRFKIKDPVDIYDWHRWFAWHSVFAIDDNGSKTLVWLETIIRRRVYLVPRTAAEWIYNECRNPRT